MQILYSSSAILRANLTLYCIVVLVFFTLSYDASAEIATFVDKVTYVQYTDDAVAFADVASGRLDIHHGGLLADLVDTSKESVRVYESKSGSYSLLINPAVSDTFNVFADRDARYALNYIIDRNIIVNELLGGHGTAMSLAYAPHDPDYVALVAAGIPEFTYDPALAQSLITSSLLRSGAQLKDEVWMYDGKTVNVTIFIRSDDLVRKSIGELISAELSKIGLHVEREYGDLNKAFVVVYGSDPAELLWNIYTEGWGGKSGFVRYDPVILAQMYAPWFSTMPGFNDPTYWNYSNAEIDELTRKIYSGRFENNQQRDEIIWQAANIGVSESVRVFLASDSILYATGSDVSGIVNDFGAGVPSRFTAINAQTPSGHLRIGVKQIYQGAWNPVMGFGDAYSSRIWATLADPAVFRNPYNGSPVPVRTTWSVQTSGPEGSIDVPSSAILWDSLSQSWQDAPMNTTATSAITFDLALSRWHHGEMMDINDILYSVYFVLEWGSERTVDDKTFDAEYASRATQFISTFRGIEILDNDRVRIYVDYWHFDEAEIADWASVWAVMPWELYAGMAHTVSMNKASFSRSSAGTSGIPWLSLAIESDTQLVANSITHMRDSSFVPQPLVKFGADEPYVAQRYNATLGWIEQYKHGVISNGPFYLDGYSPESRIILTRAFDDTSYPFAKGHWLSFVNVDLARITNVNLPSIHTAGIDLDIPVTTSSATQLRYIISPTGKTPLVSGILNIIDDSTVITLPSSTSAEFRKGALTLTLFATSQDVLRPDIFSSSFIIVPGDIEIPPITPHIESRENVPQDGNDTLYVILIVVISIMILFVLWQRRTV